MFKKEQPQTEKRAEQYQFTPKEIDLLSECIARTKNYYEGMLLLKQDWNRDKNEAIIPLIKAKIRMLDELQDRTTYIGQTDTYKNL